MNDETDDGDPSPATASRDLWNRMHADPFVDGHRVESVPVGEGVDPYLVRVLDQYLSPHVPRRVVEIGCATGHQLRGLAEVVAGVAWVGVDVSDVAIETARENFPGAEFHAAHFSDLSMLASESCGAVLVPYCFHWNTFESAQAVMTELARLTAQDGIVVLIVRSTARAVPEGATPVEGRGVSFMSPLPHEQGGPMHHFSLLELEDTFAGAGLAVLERHELRLVRERSEGYLGQGRYRHLIEGLQRGWWHCVARKEPRGGPAEPA